MTGVPVIARGFELRIGMIGPYIGGFHAEIPVLAVRGCISLHESSPLSGSHELHLPHSSTGVLDEEILRLQLCDQIQHMIVGTVAELRILGYGSEGVPDLLTMVGDGRD